MNEYLVEPSAPAMSEAAFRRRREHLLAELERPASRRTRPAVVAVAVASVLAVLAFAPISGASLAHRVATGLGDIWSTPAPPTKHPADVKSMIDSGSPPGVVNHDGTPLPGEARDLLSGLGTGNETITAYPTTNGTVCYMLRGAGSCANLEHGSGPFRPLGFAFSIFSMRGEGPQVFGIAADKVTSISVVIGGVAHPALLQNGAFYYQLPSGVHDYDIQRIVATWKNGSVHPFEVNLGHPPGDG